MFWAEPFAPCSLQTNHLYCDITVIDWYPQDTSGTSLKSGITKLAYIIHWFHLSTEAVFTSLRLGNWATHWQAAFLGYIFWISNIWISRRLVNPWSILWFHPNTKLLISWNDRVQCFQEGCALKQRTWCTCRDETKPAKRWYLRGSEKIAKAEGDMNSCYQRLWSLSLQKHQQKALAMHNTGQAALLF